MRTAVLSVPTGDRLVTDLTDEVAAFCDGLGDGLLHVFAPHATAGLAIIETGSGTEDDVAELLGRLLPRDDRYRHRHGSLGHGGDHVLPSIMSPSLSVPVLEGRPAIGVWQSIVMVDPNADNTSRSVRLSFLPA